MQKSDVNEVRKPVKAVRRLKTSQPVKEPPVKKNEEIKSEEMSVKEADIASLADDIFAVHILPDNVDDIDCDDAKNPQLVSEFINDIYRYMWSLERRFEIRKNHLECQSEVTPKMRSILIDWLVQVHLRFRLLQETLYLTVSIMDRFLQVQDIRRTRLQLIGVTSMFIAAKVEEMYAPEVQDFVYITDNAYTKAEILRTEILILRKLDFNLSKPIPLHFLRRNSKASQIHVTGHTLGKYLIEIMLPEYDLAHYSPSMMAAAASYLSMKLLHNNAPWNETMVYYSNYSEHEILPLVHKLCKVLLKAGSNKLQAIYSKYTNAKLLKISTFDELTSELVVKLASAAVE